MENMKVCQSCAMPLSTPETLGTNADGSHNDEYCVYCYKDGAFTYECTMEEMIEQSVSHMVGNSPYKTEEEARAAMQEFLPKLKRWQ